MRDQRSTNLFVVDHGMFNAYEADPFGGPILEEVKSIIRPESPDTAATNPTEVRHLMRHIVPIPDRRRCEPAGD